jgi:uncharacterized membrane protein YdjX (TVP38/TMEM64 family)
MNAPAETQDMRDSTADEQCDGKKGFRWWHWAIGAALIVGIGLAIWLLPVGDWLRTAVRWIDDLGWIGPTVFVLIYGVGVMLGAPATPLNIGAGLLFGVLWGATVSTAGALFGGVMSFLLARHVIGDWVQGKIEAYPTCDDLLERCEREPWKFLLMIRAHPLLPSSLKNYALGTTSIKLWIFAVCTIVASVPTRLVYAYLGAAGYMTLGGSPGDDEGVTTAEWWLYGVGFAVSIALTAGLTWFVRRKLKQIEQEEDDAPEAQEKTHAATT